MKERLNRVKITGMFYLCLRLTAATCLCAVYLTAQTGGITTKDQKAKEAMDAALKALGGADKIGDIKSLIIKGTYQNNLRGTNYNKHEIRILLPDNFIQITEYPDDTTFHGVSQGKFFTALPSELPMPKAEVERQMQSTNFWPTIRDSAFFLCGTLMKSGFAQLAISSDLKPGVFSLTLNTGQSRFDIHPGQIEFDAKTGYPSVIRYTDDYGGISELRFRDHFSVNGIMFPRVIERINSRGSQFERRIEEVQINPKLSLKDFEGP